MERVPLAHFQWNIGANVISVNYIIDGHGMLHQGDRDNDSRQTEAEVQGCLIHYG